MRRLLTFVLPLAWSRRFKQKRMLSSLSWQQYFTAIILLSIAWYTYIGLRYYRPELLGFFKINAKVPTTLPAVAGQMATVMGEVKPDADNEVFSSEELRFGSNEPDDIIDQTLPKGPSDDLLAEAQALINAYQDNDNKAEFLSLFKVLLSKYEVFADEISLPAVISALQTNQLLFTIKADEWPSTFAS